MRRFTPEKFLSLPQAQQQKKLAERLRVAYESYLEMLGWLGESAQLDSLEAVSKQYHRHMQSAGQQLKEHRLLPRPRQGDKATPSAAALQWSVYLDHIRSAHNVGSIIRSAEAFWLQELLFSAQTPPADNKKVRDAAMGCDEWIRCRQITDLDELPRPLVVLECAEGAIPIHDFKWPSSGCIVLGNEEFGVSDELLQRADAIVEIPLCGRKNSLNVANAFAIVASALRATQGY